MGKLALDMEATRPGLNPFDRTGNVKAAVDRALFAVSDVAHSGVAVTVTFYAGAGRTYRLERKTQMDDAMWQSIPGLPDFTANTDGPAQLTDPDTGNNAQQFYHVVMLQ